MFAPVSFSFFRLLLSFSSERKGKKQAYSKHKVIFKTDNDGLFEDSLDYFDESDFTLVSVTHDYILEDGDQMTEYEAKFRALGTKIKRLIAVKEGK